jgi:hypothetical protein
MRPNVQSFRIGDRHHAEEEDRDYDEADKKGLSITVALLLRETAPRPWLSYDG